MADAGEDEMMLSVAEAQALIFQATEPLPPAKVTLSCAHLGLLLAEDVSSDLDMPPYDKALMDGYAVRSTDLAEGRAVLTVVEEIMAGQTPIRSVGAGQAARIMTGAPIPDGADAVVMVERSRWVAGERVEIEDRPKAAQNILCRGREMRRGEVVLRAGTRLRPQEFGVLASVGRTSVNAQVAPKVAILPTGDEIVEAHETPGPGQIRNSNGPLLLAQASRAGGVPRFIGIARDNVEHLRRLVTQGLQDDILILSGGVSAGARDLVPAVLSELGVQAIFHKVEMKPGKPMFFGIRRPAPATPARPTLVFGLPGHPVSSLVCFELFVRPAVSRLRGEPNPGPLMIDAMLEEDFAYRSDRPTYHPAMLLCGTSGWRVQPVPWFGSADLRGLLPANAFVLFPPGDHIHRAGQVLPVLKVE
jgi:molybdopterin molybdotransferase